MLFFSSKNDKVRENPKMIKKILSIILLTFLLIGTFSASVSAIEFNYEGPRIDLPDGPRLNPTGTGNHAPTFILTPAPTPSLYGPYFEFDVGEAVYIKVDGRDEDGDNLAYNREEIQDALPQGLSTRLERKNNGNDLIIYGSAIEASVSPIFITVSDDESDYSEGFWLVAAGEEAADEDDEEQENHVPYMTLNPRPSYGGSPRAYFEYDVDEQINILVEGSDADGDRLKYFLSPIESGDRILPPGLHFSLEGENNLRLRGSIGREGTYSFYITIYDQESEYKMRLYFIISEEADEDRESSTSPQHSGPNHRPTFTFVPQASSSDSGAYFEYEVDEPISIFVIGQDADNDELKFFLTPTVAGGRILPPGLHVSLQGENSLRISGSIGREGVYSFYLTVSDGEEDYRKVVTFTITEVSDTSQPTDSDRDGVPDNRDDCPGTPRGSVVDSSGCIPPRESDGRGSTTPLTDSDRDGVPDYRDDCLGTPRGRVVDSAGCIPPPEDDSEIPPPLPDDNPCPGLGDNTDTDNDGTPDSCDTDDDGDGILDTIDNCPFLANPNQADDDQDNLGNVCDTPSSGDNVNGGTNGTTQPKTFLEQYNELKDQFDDYETEFDNLKDEYKDAKRNEDENDLEDAENDLDELDDNLKDLKSKVRDLENAVEDDDQDNENLLDNIEELIEDIEQLREDIYDFLNGDDDNWTSYGDNVPPTTQQPAADSATIEPITFPDYALGNVGVQPSSSNGWSWDKIRIAVWIVAGVIILLALIMFLIALLLR